MVSLSKSFSTSVQKRSSDSQRTVSADASNSTTTPSAAADHYQSNPLVQSPNPLLANHRHQRKKLTNNNNK